MLIQTHPIQTVGVKMVSSVHPQYHCPGHSILEILEIRKSSLTNSLPPTQHIQDLPGSVGTTHGSPFYPGWIPLIPGKPAVLLKLIITYPMT